jgi:hypothetical protein
MARILPIVNHSHTPTEHSHDLPAGVQDHQPHAPPYVIGGVVVVVLVLGQVTIDALNRVGVVG